MRLKIMLGALFGIALIGLAISRLSDPPGPPAPGSPTSLSAALEAAYKVNTLQRDLLITERLSRAQVLKDMRLFVQTQHPDLNRGLSDLTKLHPEIVNIQWIGHSSAFTHGTVPHGLTTSAVPHQKRAVQALRAGKEVTSPMLQSNGVSYYVQAVPDKSTAGTGIIAIIEAKIMQSVEKHQRRNLRMVPYPAEGRYRIESVLPNTKIDTTVKTGEDNGNASHYAVDEVVVKFRQPLTPEQLLKLRKELQLTVVKHLRSTYIFRSDKYDHQELTKRLMDDWHPVFVEPHYLYLTNGVADEMNGHIVPNDTLYAEYQWNLPQISAERGWDLTKGSSEIIVAVIDTGVQTDHPDLEGRLVEGINIISPSSPPEDDVGHGTHVAGIISAQTNNLEGVAGLTWYTKIMPVKVLDNTGAGTTYSVAQGILWAVDHGAQIINMSLGNYADAEFLHDALQYAYDRGVVLVAASGNDNTDRPGYPAAYPEVIGVSATDPYTMRAEYSNYGDYIDVAAPGTSIPSAYPGSQYAALSGTSMASPHVAALASLILSVCPDITNAEIADIMRETANDLGSPGKDPYFGYGQINMQRALHAALGHGAGLMQR